MSWTRSKSSANNAKNEKMEDLKKRMQDETPVKRLNAVVGIDLYDKIKDQCKTERRTISEITRQLWIDYLSKV